MLDWLEPIRCKRTGARFKNDEILYGNLYLYATKNPLKRDFDYVVAFVWIDEEGKKKGRNIQNYKSQDYKEVNKEFENLCSKLGEGKLCL